MLKIRRKATSLFRDEMFEPETDEQVFKKISIFRAASKANREANNLREVIGDTT